MIFLKILKILKNYSKLKNEQTKINLKKLQKHVFILINQKQYI